MSCEVHRSPSSALSPLTSLTTWASCVSTHYFPTAGPDPTPFLVEAKYLWPPLGSFPSHCELQQTNTRGLHSALQEGGPPPPLPFLGFSPVCPLWRRSCHSGRAQRVTSSLHVTTWIKWEGRRNHSGSTFSDLALPTIELMLLALDQLLSWLKPHRDEEFDLRSRVEPPWRQKLFFIFIFSK